MFHVVLLSLVQMDLDELAAVHFDSDPLTHDLAGEHQVLQDSVMDRS